MVPPVRPQLSDDWPAALEVGLAGTPIDGERRSGDLAVFAPYDGGALVAVIDGLGHGISAFDAAARAAEVLREHPSEPAQALLERCHAALRRTRGAVMTLAWFDLAAETLEWTGVGNVEARLLRAAAGVGAREASPVVLGGVIGFQLPKAVRTSTIGLHTGDAVAFATDGLSADFSAVLDPLVPAQAQAERMLSQHGKGTDDALAVVVRWRR
ncbi:MAG: phosphoserine phosphatase RsbX [Solirubrobacteraceae bacterium]|jgi:negative regulator of sigma-B (phosphoserine phosphatase)|nr:phosphoserine phosphatase RsbX [Solirubrobacteraceae bacterium]